jgi:hypothetical protein
MSRACSTHEIVERSIQNSSLVLMERGCLEDLSIDGSIL